MYRVNEEVPGLLWGVPTSIEQAVRDFMAEYVQPFPVSRRVLLRGSVAVAERSNGKITVVEDAPEVKAALEAMGAGVATGDVSNVPYERQPSNWPQPVAEYE